MELRSRLHHCGSRHPLLCTRNSSGGRNEERMKTYENPQSASDLWNGVVTALRPGADGWLLSRRISTSSHPRRQTTDTSSTYRDCRDRAESVTHVSELARYRVARQRISRPGRTHRLGTNRSGPSLCFVDDNPVFVWAHHPVWSLIGSPRNASSSLRMRLSCS